jgi:hypothetical protein
MTYSLRPFIGRLLVWAALLPLLASMVVAGGCADAQADGGSVRGSIYAAIRGKIGLEKRIFLPEFEVSLVSDSSGATVASTKTDMLGRFVFGHQPTGNYRACWKAAGWVAACSPETISLNGNNKHMLPIAVSPENKTLADGTVRGAYWGTVKLADGSSPFFHEQYFAVGRTAEVTVTNLAGATLYKTIANPAGEFVVVDVPAAQLRTTAQVEATSAAVVTPAATVGSADAVSITLPNSRPFLFSIAAMLGGKGVREAAPSAELDVAAEVRDKDGDPLTFTWKPAPSSGRIVSMAGNRAVWQLPKTAGRQTLYLLVSDKKGGYSTQSVTLNVTDGDVSFSGKVVTQSGVPIPNAAVTVNGRTVTGTANGAFFAKTPRADRYVVNVYAPGFATASRIFDRSGVYHEYRLVRATVTAIDPTTAVQIVDRTEGRKSNLRPAAIRLEAGSLVGSDGKAPTGPILARMATIDIANAEMPGDFGSRSGSREGYLISSGAVFAEFVDTAGNKYNLAPGKTAEIVMPSQATTKNQPKTISLWTYNEQTGYWDDLKIRATFDAARRAYVGRVPHFSFINTDIEKTAGSCVRMLVDNIDRNRIKVRVSYDSQGTPFDQTYEGDLKDSVNAIRRLPPNTNIKIEVRDLENNEITYARLLDANQQVLADNVVNTGPATEPLYAVTPYSNCVTTSIRLRPDLSDSSLSGIFPFLSARYGSVRLSNDPNDPELILREDAERYYQALDPGLSFDASTEIWSGGTHSTLGDWWTQAGFDPNTGAGGTRAAYLNHNDLGFGQDVHVSRVGDDVFAYMTLYGDPDQNAGNAQDALDQTAAKQGVTLTMEYRVLPDTSDRVTKFFAFSNGQSSGTLITSADLDGFGQKYVPQVCLNCHGGWPYWPKRGEFDNDWNDPGLRFGDLIAPVFREFDTDSFRYPGNPPSLPEGLRQTFYDLNQLVKKTNPREAIINLIDGWYAGLAPTAPPNTAFTPPGWIDQQELYLQVVAKSCRGCHGAFESTIIWSQYLDNFQHHASEIQELVCGPERFRMPMPNALMTYRNFWLDLGSPYRPDMLGLFSASDWTPFPDGCR